MIVQENLAHFLTFEHQFMITLLHDHDKKKGIACLRLQVQLTRLALFISVTFLALNRY